MRNITRSKFGFTLMLFALIFALSGCGILGSAEELIQEESFNIDPLGRAEELSELMQTESTQINEMSLEIIRCFKENDEEGFKSLFCEKSRSAPDFDEQISEAFAYLKGRISTYDIDDSAGGGQSIRDGKVTAWDVSPEIRYVKTFEDISPEKTEDNLDFVVHVYDINYFWKITNDEDTSLEGLQYMCITLLNVDEITIGEIID